MTDTYNFKDESGDKEFFTIIPNIVLNHSSVYDQALYLVIRRIAGERGSCWLTIENLAKKANMSETRLRKSLEYLLKRNWIEKIGEKNVESGQRVNEYKVNNIWHENSDFYRNKRGSLETPLQRGALETPLSIQERGALETPQRGALETPNIRSIDSNKIYTRNPKISMSESELEVKEKIQKIFEEYIKKILPGSRLTKNARDKIKSRLKEFSVEEILKGINNFSQDEWWMKNNARRGIAWFFHSDDRTEQFLNLIPRQIKKTNEIKLRKGSFHTQDFIEP